MRTGGAIGLAVLAGLLALSACGRSERDPKLLYLQRAHTAGPDEFMVLPTKPLQAPKDYAALPPPTPGGTNLTDPNPDADVAQALGGNPAAVTRTGVAAADGALISQTSRYGRQDGIRTQLAAEDLEFRRQNHGKFLERLFRQNTYFSAYSVQSLDQWGEQEAWRRKGLKTPASPPEPVY